MSSQNQKRVVYDRIGQSKFGVSSVHSPYIDGMHLVSMDPLGPFPKFGSNRACPGNLEAGAAEVGARRGRGEGGRAGGRSGGKCDWTSSDDLTIRRTGISCF